MTDKKKFRKEVEKLKSNLIYGACSSQIAMETRCKEEAYNEVLAILDTMQEEPVSEPNKELAETYLAIFNKKFPILPSLKGKQLADYKNFLNKCQQIFDLNEWGIRPIQSKLFEKLTLLWAAWGAKHLQGIGRQDEKEQNIPVSEDFEEALASEWKAYNDRGAATVDALEDNTQELAFAKGFYRGAKWKEQKDSIISEDLEEACELLAENARIRKAETISPFFSPIDYKQGVIDGTKWKEQQIMAKAIRGRVSVNIKSNYHGLIYGCWDMNDALKNCNHGDKVKVIVIKED